MKLTLIAYAVLPGAPETEISVAGDILTIDGVALDLSDLEDGGEVLFEADAGEDIPFVGPVTRQGGEIQATLRFGFDARSADPIQPAGPVVVTATNGPIPDPIRRIAQETPA
ncbi:hypothetical protein K3727_09415 [Rhodobacteraceae bacterium M382]|nr:hypothetical protein K3727_09415 [Rhodobacteraceae bacterium M382]